MTVEELLSHKIKLSPNAAKLVTGKAESIERTIEQLLVWSYARATAAHLAVNVDRIGEAIANELLPKLPAGSAGGLTMQQVVSAVEAAIRKVLGSLDDDQEV